MLPYTALYSGGRCTLCTATPFNHAPACLGAHLDAEALRFFAALPVEYVGSLAAEHLKTQLRGLHDDRYAALQGVVADEDLPAETAAAERARIHREMEAREAELLASMVPFTALIAKVVPR